MVFFQPSYKSRLSICRQQPDIYDVDAFFAYDQLSPQGTKGLQNSLQLVLFAAQSLGDLTRKPKINVPCFAKTKQQIKIDQAVR